MTSLFLAKFLGLYFLGAGLGFFLNPDGLRKLYREIFNNYSLLMFAGIAALLLGSFIISVHNIWVAAWPLLITLMGWWSFIKGVALLAYPKFIDWFSFIKDRSDAFYRSIGLVSTLLGLFFLYLSWA